jgi:hypothetical protein
VRGGKGGKGSGLSLMEEEEEEEDKARRLSVVRARCMMLVGCMDNDRSNDALSQMMETTACEVRCRKTLSHGGRST